MKSYQIIDKKTNLTEYIIKHDVDQNSNEVYELWYSHNGEWSNKTVGTLALTMVDSGNDIVFKPQLSKKFDYSEFEKVRILMQFQEQIKTSLKNEYKIIEEVAIGEI